ncbi:ATP-binding protein [Methylobacterium sp. JK268]
MNTETDSSPVGHVIAIRDSKVTLELIPSEPRPRVTYGSYLAIHADTRVLVAVVTALTSGEKLGARAVLADLDLLGEFIHEEDRAFRRGVTTYPVIGDTARLLASADLQLIHRVSAAHTATIGTHAQDPSLPACIKADDLLAKHFAVLGATGVGKSSGVAVVLDAVLGVRPDMRAFLLDVHNEYAACFGARANVINPRSLKLPFWLFNIEEVTDVIYGGRPPVDEEIEILAELVPAAKARYAQYKEAGERQLIKRNAARTSGFTVDTPVPYLLQDLVALIDERMGRLENRNSRLHHHRLITRIETIRSDPRYAFMFDNANVGGDVMGDLLAHLFRLQPDGRPITIMQLAGLPAEVLDAVVCVLCRLAFEFGIWSDGAVPLLFVCEEAHRYASADRSVGFSPTRRALSRIAREGRKHGVHLGLVTQRPAELDPAIISQCSTVFAMRMTNDRDQAYLAAAVSDTANLLSFVPLLGTGECIAFGEGVPIPARVRFSQLAPDALPRADTSGAGADGLSGGTSAAFVGAVVERWRVASMNKGRAEPDLAAALGARDAAAEGGAGAALDQAHRRLLRRPLDAAEASPGQPSRPAGDGLWSAR